MPLFAKRRCADGAWGEIKKMLPVSSFSLMVKIYCPEIASMLC
jgi:hypothetical protein